MTDDELPELPPFLNERGRSLFRTLWNRGGPVSEAEMPGLITICYSLQKNTEDEKELMQWLEEYELTRKTMRRKAKREAADV